MSFDFRFKFLEDEKELIKLKDFLLKQSLNYSNYEDWVEKAIHEIDLGYKRTILAFSDGIFVGDLIFQPHKTLSKLLEIKNLRIHPNLKRRYFGFFMVKQIESEAKNYDGIIVDTRSEKKEVVNLFNFCGYREIARTSLYDKNIEDVILFKNLKN